MSNWTEIKSKILFSYMGSDWVSVSVSQAEPEEIKEFLDERVDVELKTEGEGVFTFENASTEVCFYLNSDQHFDFDPKNILTLEQWNQFIDLFKEMSTITGREVLFRPEHSLLEEKSIITRITEDRIEYNFRVFEEYRT